jgi:hypothetical protein
VDDPALCQAAKFVRMRRKKTENRQQALDIRSSHVSNAGQSDETRKSGVASNRLGVRSHPGRSGRPTSSAFPLWVLTRRVSRGRERLA